MPSTEITLNPIKPFQLQVPIGSVPGMRVPGVILAAEDMSDRIIQDRTPIQVANVATLPGIVKASMAMPDIHWGYGFPIGGVAAFDVDDGIISPGGVGYDINCGVTLVRSNVTAKKVKPRIQSLIDSLFNAVPCGVGSEGKLKLNVKDFDGVLSRGANWLVEHDFAEPADVEHMEETGCIQGGDPKLVSARARQRAQKQLGSLGSGNHFIEIQEVAEVFDATVAERFGLFPGQICLMIHSGSRGLGHQVCDDYLSLMQQAVKKYKIELPDRQLACAPFKSQEGQEYFAAMKCAANFAWANRLMMVNLSRKAISKLFKTSVHDLGLEMVYDVCHNIAKEERYTQNQRGEICSMTGLVGKQSKILNVCVHRKGATRSLGAGHPDIPKAYRSIGQPVIIPGDMGRASYVLVGTSEAASVSFNSSCHGAGRVMSRKAAIRNAKGKNIPSQLAARGIIVRAKGKMTLVEEVPEAYKNIDDVVESVIGAGVSKPVARMKPLGTIKG